jgi:hypothetical protein
MMMLKELPASWSGWYFENGFLCSPFGDKLSPYSAHAIVYERQMRFHAQLLYGNTAERFHYQ